GCTMVHRAFALLDLRGQRPAEGDVEFLYAAANGEQGHAALDRLADQRKGGGVPRLVIGPIGLGGLAAIERGVDVRLRSRHHDAVNAIQKPVKVETVTEG